MENQNKFQDLLNNTDLSGDIIADSITILSDLDMKGNDITNVNEIDGVSISGLDNRITTNTNDISTNTSNINSNSNAIQTNTNNISILDSEVLKKDGSVDLVVGYTPSNNQSIATKNYVDTADTSLQTQITNNDTDIQTNVNNIALNTNNISTNSANISSNDTDITNLQNDKLNRDGTNSMTGDLNLNSNKIINLAAPTLNNDATTKNYVDLEDANLQTQITNNDTDITNLQNNKVNRSGDTITGNLNFAQIGRLQGLSIIEVKNPTGPSAGTSLLIQTDPNGLGNIDSFEVDANKNTSYHELDINNNKIVNLAAPTSASDATNKNYVDGVDNNLQNQITNLQNDKLNRDGTQTMTGNLNLDSNKIINLAAPTLANDAATKTYVDTHSTSVNYLRVDGTNSMTGDLNFNPIGTKTVRNITELYSSIPPPLQTEKISLIIEDSTPGNSRENLIVSYNVVEIKRMLDMSLNQIVNLATPTQGNNAANKNYVDSGDNNLQSQINNNDTDISNIQSDITTIQGNITTLQNDKFTKTGDIITGDSQIDGSSTLEFGANVSGKDVNAGKIGYQKFTTNALDIIGAGTAGFRKVRLWDELRVRNQIIVEDSYTNFATFTYYAYNTWGGIASGNVPAAIICVNGRVLAPEFNATSDRRCKENIKNIPDSKLDSFLKLEGKSYNWKHDQEHKRKHYGFISQDCVKNDLLEIVNFNQMDGMEEQKEDPVYGVYNPPDLCMNLSYNDFIPLLHGLCKRQQVEIDSLKERLNILEQKISSS